MRALLASTCLACAFVAGMAGAQPSASTPWTAGAKPAQIVGYSFGVAAADDLPPLCSAPRFDESHLREFDARVASRDSANDFVGSISNNRYIVLEYDSVFDVHTPVDPGVPLRQQAGAFATGTVLGHLASIVDPTKYDFVLLYSLSEMPGWINSGAINRIEAKNIGWDNRAAGTPVSYPQWPRLRGVPHMNSVDFIPTIGTRYRGMPGAVFVALHEIGHHWSVLWAQNNNLPRLSAWTPRDPLAWLAAGGWHWSYLFEPSEAAGIMYSGPLSEYFTDFDLYAMGLMSFDEASQATYRVKEDRPGSPAYSFGLGDLLDSLRLQGSNYLGGNERRVPEMDATAQEINILVVVVKGRNESISAEQDAWLSTVIEELPSAWRTATRGRSTANATPGPACNAFTDVSPTSPFCPHVEWLRNRGVTLGCSAGLYCPADPVSRLAMSAFMNRMGRTLTPDVLQIENEGWIVDPDDNPVICTTDSIVENAKPRRAHIDGIFTAKSVASSGIGVDVVSSFDSGASWAPVATGTKLGLRPAQWANVRMLGEVELPLGEPLHLGLRISRTGGAGGVIDAGCVLRVRLDNRNPAASPFDSLN